MARKLLPLLLSLAFLSCNENYSITLPDGPLGFSEVHKDQQSGIRVRRTEVISNQGRWAEVWDEIYQGRTPKPGLPAVDFSGSVLLLAALGEEGDACKSVAIDRVEQRGGAFVVGVKEVRAPASCVCPPVTVKPVHVVRAPRVATTGSFEFRSVTEGSPCN